MPILNGEVLLETIMNERIVWLSGRVRSGKTSLAYRIAHDLVVSGKVRYIFSNVKSVWNDDPEHMVLRDGRFVDAVIILDEGGLFLKSSRQADRFMSFLGKLNVVVMIASRAKPSTKLTMLSIQRLFNAAIIGLPFWFYKMTLLDGSVKETDRFIWKNPSEVWGVFDSYGFPSDANVLADYLRAWTDAAAKKTGYTTLTENENKAGQDLSWAGSATFNGFGIMDAIESLSEDVLEGSRLTDERLSLLGDGKRKA